MPYTKPIRFGPWLRDYLSDGGEHYANEVYHAYKRAHRLAYQTWYEESNIPVSKRQIHKQMGRTTFINYLWFLRKLQWIAYVPDPSEPDGIRKQRSISPTGGERLLFTITPEGMAGDWTDIRRSYEDTL